jgi:signal transduction histidine kinase
MFLNDKAGRRIELLSGLTETKESKFQLLAQFYEDGDILTDSVALFLFAGFALGSAGIIIARREHQESFKVALSTKGVNVESVLASGQLVLMDVGETLDKLFTHGRPDQSKFEKVIGGLMDRMRETFPSIRVYGEMLGHLCDVGDIDGAMQLEDFWNDLAKTHNFSLLCGYGLNKVRQFSGPGFKTNCETHSHVKKLQASNAHLRHAIETRDEFLSIASHEIKTPLTSLKMVLDLAKRRIKAKPSEMLTPEDLGKILEISSKQVMRLTTLLDEMLDVSKIRIGKIFLSPIQVNFADLVKEVYTSFQEELVCANYLVTLDLIDNVIGYWDRNRIEQVVVNLISNAIKYGAGHPIKLSVFKEGRWAKLVVEDSGCGIPKDKQAAIFERYERVTNSNAISGLGLGLFIVREIVEAHKGNIVVHSSEGKGSTFIVELPLLPSVS